jgi:hypothetical protein
MCPKEAALQEFAWVAVFTDACHGRADSAIGGR